MKIKLDENIGERGLDLLRQRGHDVMTVRQQGLNSAPDERIFEVCAAERRVLITLDWDFGEVLRFNPADSAGIVILSFSSRITLDGIRLRLANFLGVAETNDVSGSLWIVEAARVRIHLNKA